MKTFFQVLLIALVSSFTLNTAVAQNIAGTYKVAIKGNKIKTNQQPVKTPIQGKTTFTITQTGDEITVTMAGYKSEWSAHIMSGRVGNKHFIATLANSDRSVYQIAGHVNPDGTLEGHYIYSRYGDANSGIVPGWTKVKFKAKKQ